MSIDQQIALFDLILRYIQTLIWPFLIVVFILVFRRSIQQFFSDVSEFTLRAAGVEASYKRRQVEAAALLGAAVAGQTGEGAGTLDPARAGEIAAAVHQATQPRTGRQLGDAVVLWVDDHPENNVYERQALEVLGIRFVVATSTDEGERLAQGRRFDAIVSDMGRPPDNRAGYTLLERLRAPGALNASTPFIIYSAAGSRPEHQREAALHGAFGSTNFANDLFQLVVDAVAGAPTAAPDGRRGW